MEIKHVFFDLDHTLWDFEKNAELCFQQIFAQNHIQVDISVFLEVYRPINRSYWKLYREEKIAQADLRYRRFKDAFDALEYEISEEIIHTLSDAFIKNLSNNNFLLQGAIEVLEYLKKKYVLHIITNGFNEIQDSKLEKSKIKPYFKTITTSDAVGVKKPNPKIFDYAIKMANAKKEESVMIGDDFEADIEGAFKSGIKPIYLTSQKNKLQTNFISISSLLELKQYL